MHGICVRVLHQLLWTIQVAALLCVGLGGLAGVVVYDTGGFEQCVRHR